MTTPNVQRATPAQPDLAADVAWCRERERETEKNVELLRTACDKSKSAYMRAEYDKVMDFHLSEAARYGRIAAALELLDAVERRMTRAECVEPESGDAWAWVVNVRPDVEEPPDEGKDFGGGTFREAMAAALADKAPAPDRGTEGAGR